MTLFDTAYNKQEHRFSLTRIFPWIEYFLLTRVNTSQSKIDPYLGLFYSVWLTITCFTMVIYYHQTRRQNPSKYLRWRALQQYSKIFSRKAFHFDACGGPAPIVPYSKSCIFRIQFWLKICGVSHLYQNALPYRYNLVLQGVHIRPKMKFHFTLK